MSLGLLIPVSLAMGLMALWAFFWALRHQQFEDLDGAAWRVLASIDPDEGPAPPPEPTTTDRVEMVDGQFLVAAELVAAAFDLTTEEVRAGMQAGTITSRTERGEGEDAGRHRLTFFHQDRAYRLTISDDGTILHRTRFTTGR